MRNKSIRRTRVESDAVFKKQICVMDHKDKCRYVGGFIFGARPPPRADATHVRPPRPLDPA